MNLEQGMETWEKVFKKIQKCGDKNKTKDLQNKDTNKT
jgi:hypothetical protein